MRWPKMVLIVLAMTMFSGLIALRADTKQFEGVTLRLVTEDGYNKNSALAFKGPWEEKTGAKIVVEQVPFGELYTKIMTSFAMGTGTYDLLLTPSGWLGDFSQYLLPLDSYLKNDKAYLEWNDILPVYRERVVTWGGATYALPLDGDLVTGIMRTELLDNPKNQAKFQSEFGYKLGVPKTWQEYRDIAKFANNWDWAGTGKPQYGCMESMKKGGQAYWMYLDRAMPYVAVPGVPDVFFDANTMKAEINNPGFVKALDDWKELIQYGVPGMTNMDVNDAREVYGSGDAALMVDWGDMPEIGAMAGESKIRGKFVAFVNPGSKHVWDKTKNSWVDYPNINVAPFLAFGGWHISIAKSSKNVQAAYDFARYYASPAVNYKDVTMPRTGHQPLRNKEFADLSGWIKYGFINPKREYLGAVEASLSNSNTRPDLRIPGTARYYEALDTQLSRAISGELTSQQALDECAQKWEQITDELGRDKQIAAYKAMLGITD